MDEISQKILAYENKMKEQPNVGKRVLWQFGPSPEKILATPLFYFPLKDYPITRHYAENLLGKFLEDLQHAPNPIDTLEHKISTIESSLGLSLPNGPISDNRDRILNQLAQDINHGLEQMIYHEVTSMSTTPLEKILGGISYLPTKFENWETNDDAWKQLISHISNCVTQTFFLQKLRGLYNEYTADATSTKTETIPESEAEDIFEAHPSQASHLAWLYELGIVDHVVKTLCTEPNSVPNLQQAGNIIGSFTGLNAETTRKMLTAIYSGNLENEKNNPLRSPKNKTYTEFLAAKYNLKKG